jgi:hypothetical protein
MSALITIVSFYHSGCRGGVSAATSEALCRASCVRCCVLERVFDLIIKL